MKFWKRKVRHHYYWVSYSYKKGTEMGTGAAEISLSPMKITCEKDISLIRNWINEYNFKGKATVAITNFIYLRTERKVKDDTDTK